VTEEHTEAFAVFRSRRGRLVALVMGGLVLALSAIGAVLMPGPDVGGNWTFPDRLMLLAFGLVIALFLWRYAMIRAVPTRDGLTVRNLMLTHHLEWSQVVGVQFAGGDPWLRLDLDDTEQLPVMAIQKADGAHGRREAARMAALVEALGSADEPGGTAGGEA
jgi:hypothetical protein